MRIRAVQVIDIIWVNPKQFIVENDLHRQTDRQHSRNLLLTFSERAKCVCASGVISKPSSQS